MSARQPAAFARRGRFVGTGVRKFVLSAVPRASPPCSPGADRLQAAPDASRQRLATATQSHAIPTIQTQRRKSRRPQRTGMSKWWTSSRVPSDA